MSSILKFIESVIETICKAGFHFHSDNKGNFEFGLGPNNTFDK